MLRRALSRRETGRQGDRRRRRRARTHRRAASWPARHRLRTFDGRADRAELYARYPRTVAGAAIWNANFSAGSGGRLARGLLGAERMLLGSDVPSRIMPKLTFGNWAARIPHARTPFDWLSRDTAVVDAYIADPDAAGMPRSACGAACSTSSSPAPTTGASPRCRTHCPSTWSAAARIPPPAAKATHALAERLAAMGFIDVETRVYPGMRHESLNEVGRDAVMEDFAFWASRARRRGCIPARFLPFIHAPGSTAVYARRHRCFFRSHKR